LEKRYTRQCYTEEKLDEIGVRMFALQIPDTAEQPQVSTATACRATKNICLLPCKIRQVQATDGGDYRGSQNFNFLLKKFGSI
jgi:hypothetical protein